MRKPEFVKRNCDSCGREVIADLTSRNHKICEDCAACPGYEPAETAEPKCEGCGEIDYDGKHPIPPHRCNGVDGAARHGYANACTICGRFSAQRHEGCPKPDTSDISPDALRNMTHREFEEKYLGYDTRAKPSDIEAARAFAKENRELFNQLFLASGSESIYSVMSAYATHVLAEKTPGIRAEAVRDAFEKVEKRCQHGNWRYVMAQVAKEMTEDK